MNNTSMIRNYTFWLDGEPERVVGGRIDHDSVGLTLHRLDNFVGSTVEIIWNKGRCVIYHLGEADVRNDSISSRVPGITNVDIHLIQLRASSNRHSWCECPIDKDGGLRPVNMHFDRLLLVEFKLVGKFMNIIITQII